MEFFKKQTRIDFMGVRRYTGIVIGLLSLASLALVCAQGLNLGLDFTGGTKIEARFSVPVLAKSVREQLEKEGFQGVRVQQFGSTQDVLIRLGNTSEKTAESTPSKEEQKIQTRIKTALLKHNKGVEIRRTEFVGAEVGSELVEKGGIAILLSILATMVYIAFRFEYRLAVSAAVGLCHDTLLILGVFALFRFEFDLSTLASVLAVLGYSLNDTIVVFDRVRENFRKMKKNSPSEIMNLSINQTLSRTLMTSWMTLLVVLALIFCGGENLFSLSMAFFVGIVAGTFSSIYVSGALALWMGLTRADLILKPKAALEGP